MKSIFYMANILIFILFITGCLEKHSDDFIKVEGGTLIGSEKYRSSNEDYILKPGRKITIDTFYICDHEVTQKEYMQIMGKVEQEFSGDNFPIVGVSWYAAVIYCNQRSFEAGLEPCYLIKGERDPEKWNFVQGSDYYDEMTGACDVECDFSRNGYRLPTETEWEFAARGGKKSRGYKFSGSDELDEVGWFEKNSSNIIHEVKTKKANEIGIYDMSGNVCEWVWDCYSKIKLDTPTRVDCEAEKAFTQTHRVLKDGNWLIHENFSIPSHRFHEYPNNHFGTEGFRLARSCL